MRRYLWEMSFLVLLGGIWLLEQSFPRWWPVAVLICLPHFLALAPLLWLSRRRRGPWLLACWILWLAVGGPQWRGSLPPGGIRIATYNVQGKQPRALMDRLEVDLCALQEVGSWTSDSPYCARDGEFVTLSRFPIASSGLKGRIQVVDLQLPQGPLRLLNVHLTRHVQGPGWLLGHALQLGTLVPAGMQVREREIADILDLVQGPCLVVGDFNAQPGDATLGPLSERLVDSFGERGRGWGFTWQSTLPLLRIDYLWHTPDITCSRAWVPFALGSDHWPLVGEFSPPGNTRETAQECAGTLLKSNNLLTQFRPCSHPPAPPAQRVPLH